MSQLFCVYCGQPREMFCRQCKENHLVTADEYREANGEWPDDGIDHPETDSTGYEVDAAGTFKG